MSLIKSATFAARPTARNLLSRRLASSSPASASNEANKAKEVLGNATAYVQKVASSETAAQAQVKAKQAAELAKGAFDNAAAFAQKVATSDAAAQAQVKAKQALQEVGTAASKRVSPGVKGAYEKVAYYAKVVYYVGREVAIREKLAPPKLKDYPAAKSEFFQLLGQFREVPFVKQRTLSNFTELVRNGNLGPKFFVAAEIGTFFLVGEIIGRRNFVGYDVPSTKVPVAHH